MSTMTDTITKKNGQFSIKNWDEYARVYKNLKRLIPYDVMQKTIALESKLIPGNKILDAACGPGIFIDYIIDIVKQIKYFGVDYSEAMLNQAKKEYQDHDKNIDFGQCDLNLSLPTNFKNNSFDRIISTNTIYALNDPEFFVRELTRFLKPGGRLIVVTPKKGYENGLILKAHCHSQELDEYWTKAESSQERAFSLIKKAFENDKELGEIYLAIALFNIKIKSNTTFNFFDEQEFTQLFDQKKLKIKHIGLTYAEQNLMLIAEKS